MKKLAMWSMAVLLSFALTGCGKCEHEYDNGVITKESTCISEGKKTYTCQLCNKTRIESMPKNEHTYREEIMRESTYTEEGEKTFICTYCNNSYTESIPVLDAEPYNENIYEQMIIFYDDGDYLNALIIGRNALPNRGKSKTKINQLIQEIIISQNEYIEEQLQSAIENSDYEAFDTLYYYKGYGVKFSENQELAYKFVEELQGKYRYFKKTDSNIQLRINGFNLEIGDEEYISHFIFMFPDENRAPRLVFEGGSIEQIRTGLIAITYDDGTCIKYESDAGKEWEEKQAQIEETKKQLEQKRKQEYLANEPRIGMTADEVKKSNWGSPNKINKTTYEWGVTEQWCYSKNRYIYLEDGIVIAISE